MTIPHAASFVLLLHVSTPGTDMARARGTTPPPDSSVRRELASAQLEAMAPPEPVASSGESSHPRGREPRERMAPMRHAPEGSGGGLIKPDLPVIDVNAYRDVVEDALSVLDRLSEEERAEVRELNREGDDAIRRIKDIGDSDHVGRARELDVLRGVTAQLQELHRAGVSDRRVGRPFVPANLSSTGWSEVNLGQDGLEALRVRFVRPGSAHVTLVNASSEARPAFVEVELTDAAGGVTGSGAWESSPLEDLVPGEKREVLVQIVSEHRFMWERTRAFTLHLE